MVTLEAYNRDLKKPIGVDEDQRLVFMYLFFQIIRLLLL
jgi:hypothetical protein